MCQDKRNTHPRKNHQSIKLSQNEEPPSLTTLITGASGYIGSRLAQRLHAQEHTVPGIDRQPYDGNALTTGTLVERIVRLLGKTPPSWHIPLSIATPIAKVSDIAADLTSIDFPSRPPASATFNRSTNFDASKIREAGFEQPVSNKEALENTVRWHVEGVYGEMVPTAEPA